MAEGREAGDRSGIPSAELQGPLPPELWDVVLSKADYKTLKATRKVNSVFRDLSTPFLFDHVVYSVDERNVKNLRLLTKTPHLSKHVRRLYLDTTSYRQGLDTRQYSQLTASYFQAAFDLPRQLSASPLSEQSLLRVLRADPLEDLGSKCLSGTARRGYVNGYATYIARSDYYRELLEDGGVYKHLKDFIPKLINLRHVDTLTIWSPVDSRKRLECFLRRTLPENTLKSISGLSEATPLSSDGKTGFASGYCAPGQTSRRLNLLTPPPNFSGCWGDTTTFDLLTAALRALHECKPKLETLSLPGTDELSDAMPLKDRMGIIPIPALLTVPRSTPAASKKTLLLPLFQGLKSLELKLDFAHPGTQSTFRYHMDPTRLCTALQSLTSIERLSLGAVDYPEEAQADPWSIYETMLRSEDDDESILPKWNALNPDGDDEDVLDGALEGLPAGVEGIPFAMLAASLGIPQAQGPTPASAAPNAAAAATAPVTGILSATNAPSASTTTQTSPPHDTTPKIHPSTPLKPNPWPRLKYLNLFNLPATKEDLCRLIRTIASSATLHTLQLHHVYLDDRLRTQSGMISALIPPPSYPVEKIAPHWLEVIDLMADELGTLKEAAICPNERDSDYIFDLMAEKVDGFGARWMCPDIDECIDKYLTEEDTRGIGFATFMGGLVKELGQDDEAAHANQGDSEDEWEDDDTDEDLPDLI